VTLVVSWPEQGVPEARGELDGTMIRAAARRAGVLWPDEPDLESSGAWQSSTIIAEASDEEPPQFRRKTMFSVRAGGVGRLGR
jgi:hypothetical protein